MLPSRWHFDNFAQAKTSFFRVTLINLRAHPTDKLTNAWIVPYRSVLLWRLWAQYANQYFNRFGYIASVERALWLADTRHPYTRGLHADVSLLSACNWLFARLIPSRFIEVFLHLPCLKKVQLRRLLITRSNCRLIWDLNYARRNCQYYWNQSSQGTWARLEYVCQCFFSALTILEQF